MEVPPTETRVPDTARTETEIPGASNPSSTYSSNPLQLQRSSETYTSQGSIETPWLQVGSSSSQTPSLSEVFVEPSQPSLPPSQSIIPPEISVQAEQGFERVKVEAQPEAPQPSMVPQPQPEELQPSLVPQPQPEETQRGEPQPGPPQSSQGTQRRRALRRNRRHKGVPRWVYDLETRRIAAEQRKSETLARLLAVAERIADSHEAMASNMREIRENMTRHDNNE